MTPRLPAAFLVLLMVLSTAPLVTSADDAPDVRISEVLVSASSEDYDGVDWNGDGVIGSVSDQFIEIWNADDSPVDVSDWWLDDEEGGGTPSCSPTSASSSSGPTLALNWITTAATARCSAPRKGPSLIR